MKLDGSIPFIATEYDHHSERSGFYGGIVLYHPDSGHHFESIRILLLNNIEVIVFDNSEDKEIRERNRMALEQTFAGQIRYMETAQGNIGLPAAFNRIIHVAKEDTFAQGLFLFDQDTDVNVAALRHLIESFTILQAQGQPGLVAGYPIRDSGIPYRIRPRSSFQSPIPELIAVEMAPSSFSLIPLTTFAKVGEFPEDFFIDHIDWDFCSRCWRYDLPVFVDKRATFVHRIGLGDVTILNKPLFPIASPFRHYYQTRNIILSHTRAGLPFFTTVRAIALKVIVVSVIGIYAGGLIQRLRNALLGIMDGIKGRGGRRTYARLLGNKGYRF
jgi:rhamnosyltransferase